MAFAEELHTSLPAVSQSSIRRGRKPHATSSAKPAKADTGTVRDQNQHSGCVTPLEPPYRPSFLSSVYLLPSSPSLQAPVQIDGEYV